MKKRISIFPEEVLEELSVNYRYMVQELANKQGELNLGQRFSTSDIHRTSDYMTVRLYKPISNIYLSEKDEDLL
ncbi:hypothetical protein CLV51_10525 [Chitinophaga niastensis]|uniref:Uncharacterized protein n=1 Tax=Chitinophaga niastensis TaxID=536980 RepID=A0A2P8HEL3_CHINA|nr:hypothetical protein [Chitinophaga niastensis]PSL44653.1 hypothetical protein CLV51_10525 [Chitinophaga niastensis]